MVMDMLERIDAEDRVEMLRLIAQDDRPMVSTDALQRLELLGKTEAAQQAAGALHSLQFVLPPAMAELAERSLRKLRFGGVTYQAPEPHGWQTLMTSSDPSGHQTVWLVHWPVGPGDPGIILGFVLNYRIGIRQMFGSEDLPVEHLPRQAANGALVLVNAGGGNGMIMLAAPFDYGRWLVSACVQGAGIQCRMPSSFPDEYKLYNDLIWRYAQPQIDSEVESFLVGEDPANGPDDLAQDDLDARIAALAEDAVQLLNDPSMSGWSRQNLMLAQAVRPLRNKLDDLPNEFIVQQIQREIANWKEAGVLMEALETSLRAQAAWFHYAGNDVNARRAMRLVSSIQTMPVDRNPLLAHMIGLGLAQILKE